MTAPPRRLRDLGPFTEAERRIRDGVGSGEVVLLGEWPASGDVKDLLPAEGDETRRVRAAFLRFLILGGDPDCRPHQRGVRVAGAWITGALDMEGCRAPRDVGLLACRFDAAPMLRSAALDGLFLNHSHLPGLTADRLETRGGVFMRGATVRGEARLPGARLGGDLDCDGATFERPEGVALSADGLETRGDVFLRGATVRGEARLPGARLGGDLSCVGATFERPGGKALNAARARIGGALFLRDGAKVSGALDLTAAEIGAICDGRACWPGPGDLLLDRCRYGAFTGGPVDAAARLDWLSRLTPARWGRGFWPQPYVQLATVLREMGHDADARAVLIEKERLQRQALRDDLRARLRGARLRLAVETMKPSTVAAVKASVQARHRDPWTGGAMHENDPRRSMVDQAAAKARQFREIADAPAADARAAVARIAGPAVDPALAARAPIVALRLHLAWRCVWDGLVGVLIGYGRRPEKAAVWAGGLWLAGLLIFAAAFGAGAFKPNNPFVVRAPEWVRCAAPVGQPIAPPPSFAGPPTGLSDGQTQLACFRAQPEGADYPSFNPFLYSLDTLLPIFEVGQQAHWLPAPGQDGRALWLNDIGWWAKAYLYFQIIAGWALSLLAVAGFSGLVKKD